jgi:hypothetical protein
MAASLCRRHRHLNRQATGCISSMSQNELTVRMSSCVRTIVKLAIRKTELRCQIPRTI